MGIRGGGWGQGEEGGKKEEGREVASRNFTESFCLSLSFHFVDVAVWRHVARWPEFTLTGRLVNVKTMALAILLLFTAKKTRIISVRVSLEWLMAWRKIGA